jgi:hypothetical protein
MIFLRCETGREAAYLNNRMEQSWLLSRPLLIGFAGNGRAN